MSYTKIAVRGAFTVLIISLLAAFLGYVVRILLARNLSVEEFGLFYAVFSFLGLIGIFKSLGFDKAITKFIPEFQHKKKHDFIKSSIIYVAAILFVTNTIVIVLVYLLSGFLAVNFFKSPESIIVLKLLAISFFVDSFVEVLKSAFQGFKKMGLFSIIDVIRMLLIIIIMGVGFKLNQGILSPVIAYVLVPIMLIFIFGYVLFFRIFPEFWGSSFVLEKKLLKKISNYSVFLILTRSGRMILGYTDVVLLTFFTGLTSVALYNVALPTARLLHYFTKSITEILLPLTSELWAAKKLDILKEGIESVYKYSVIVILPLTLVTFSFADLIIGVFFGSSYIAAAAAMKILSIGMIFLSLAVISITFFSGIGKPQISSKMVFIAAIVNLIGNLILIPILGIVGAAITTTASYFVMMLIGFLMMRKFLVVSLPLTIWFRTSIAGIVFMIMIWLLKKILFLNVFLEAIVVLVVSGLIYILLLFVLRILNISELKSLYKRIRS